MPLGQSFSGYHPGVEACSWALHMGFLVEGLFNSPSVRGGKKINSMFLNLQNNLGELVRNTGSWMLSLWVGSGMSEMGPRF